MVSLTLMGPGHEIATKRKHDCIRTWFTDTDGEGGFYKALAPTNPHVNPRKLPSVSSKSLVQAQLEDQQGRASTSGHAAVTATLRMRSSWVRAKLLEGLGFRK